MLFDCLLYSNELSLSEIIVVLIDAIYVPNISQERI